MPQYFFHIDNGSVAHDDEGTVFKDLATAKCQGMKLVGQTMCDASETFWDQQEWSLTVTNEAGLSLFSVHVLGTEAPAVASQARHHTLPA